jgi:L-ribulokinase
MSKYSVGVDFGTLSARALLIDIMTGEELSQSVFEYSHGVMETRLPGGAELGAGWALQHPQDYIDALGHTVREVVKNAGVNADSIIGIGIDFTSCTVLPVKADGTPLCFLKEFENEPHAYAKLWKHHAAQYCANILNETAEKLGEDWLALYGGRISSEWVVPKAMQIAKEAPGIYAAADRIIEAGDWVVWQLCGQEARSACNAGYKALWQHGRYPSKEFFKALDPRMENFVQEKLTDDIRPLGTCADFVTKEAAKLTGLSEPPLPLR